MIEVAVDVSTLAKKLRKLERQISNRDTANRKASIALHGWVMRNFRDEGALGGKKWPPLKAGGRWKGRGKDRKLQTGYRLLQDTGHLRQSFTWFYDKSTAGVGAKLYPGDGPTELAAIHEYGAPKANIPARKMLPSKAEALKIGVQVYRRHLELERGAT